MNDLLLLNRRLLDRVRSDDYAGYDPFDLLNSRILKATPLYRSEWVRLAFIQLGKRSPVNLRSLLAVPKKRNPKGVALFISGMLRDFERNQDEWYLDEARRLGVWLSGQCSDPEVWTHASWGYHFDWQARAFFVPAGKPNIITTCYAARALHELGHVTGEQHWIDQALDAARFISNHLYTQVDGRRFFAYIPGELTFVHNASLWGSAWCVVTGHELGDHNLILQGLEVARQSVGDQREDGSWLYGTRHHHNFIDGFHTGYNLEALDLIRRTLSTPEFDDAIERGFQFYAKHFFEPDGTAKYYHDRAYPLDMHNFAQAVFTLLKVGNGVSGLVLTERVLMKSVEKLFNPKTGMFNYQRTSNHTNRISYVRWTQAWAYYAIAYFNWHRAITTK